jgi:hypothetical protein
MVETDPNLTRPEMRRRWTAPCAWTPTTWPILKCSFEAVDLSMTTSFAFGQAPLIRWSGLKREAPFAMLKPRFGAPP